LYQLFKGITITSDTNSNTILGFSKSSMVMRMYYTLKDEDSEDNNYHSDFTIQSYTRNFNKITSDRASTFLSSLITYEDYIKSTSTNNLAYI